MQTRMHYTAFERFAGVCALLVGIIDLLYGIAFVILQNILLSGLFLMLGGLLSTVALLALYYRLREANAAFALLVLLLGITGALGSAIHGGYDLANAIHPLSSAPAAELPNPVDPRGLLTFGLAGVALLIGGWLIVRGGVQLPKGLGYLALLAAGLLVVLYVGRLVIFDPRSPLIVVPALLSGFLVNPALYLWLGVIFLRGRRGSFD